MTTPRSLPPRTPHTNLLSPQRTVSDQRKSNTWPREIPAAAQLSPKTLSRACTVFGQTSSMVYGEMWNGNPRLYHGQGNSKNFAAHTGHVFEKPRNLPPAPQFPIQDLADTGLDFLILSLAIGFAFLEMHPKGVFIARWTYCGCEVFWGPTKSGCCELR